MADNQADTPRPLHILGVGEDEERAYRWLVTHPEVTAARLARALAIKGEKARRLLEAIENKGLATHTPQRPRRYIPVAPDIGLRALIIQHQEGLLRAEGLLKELQDQAVESTASGESDRMVELITSREAEQRIFEHMQQSARSEVISLIHPPMLVSKLDPPYEQDQAVQRTAQTRGVRYRAIVDAAFLALPGAVSRIRSDMKSGEEVRTVKELPFKMILADRRVAIIPLSLRRTNSPSLLVRPSALLDALQGLFEILWERAVPLSFVNGDMVDSGKEGSEFPEDSEVLISLLAAGLNDKKIADELGVSMRTLTRRLVELSRSLEAQTRFQVGWAAALRFQGSKPPG